MFKPHVLRGFFHHPRAAELAHSHTTCDTPKFVKTPKVSKRAETRGRRGVLRKNLPAPHCSKKVQNSSATHQNVLCAFFCNLATSPRQDAAQNAPNHAKNSSATRQNVLCACLLRNLRSGVIQKSSKTHQKLLCRMSARPTSEKHMPKTPLQIVCAQPTHSKRTPEEDILITRNSTRSPRRTLGRLFDDFLVSFGPILKTGCSQCPLRVLRMAAR